jgi:hypothetical protein
VPTWPQTVWRYAFRLDLEGSERQDLPDALEEEPMALWDLVSRAEAFGKMREGRLAFEARLPEPLPSFPQDLATFSVYLFQIVKGFEIAERFVAEGVTDDVRAWKVVARQGEWVKLPLVVRTDGEGRFHVDEDADDLEVLAARWGTYPLWFQDGMRRKHPSLRAL